MVGQLQAVDTGLDRPAGVGGAERPLDDQLAGPLLPQGGDVVPVDARVEELPVPAMVTRSRTGRLARFAPGCAASAASIRAATRCSRRCARSARAARSGRCARPGCAAPVTIVSTVTTSTRYPQAAARSTSSRVSPLVGQDVQLEPQVAVERPRPGRRSTCSPWWTACRAGRAAAAALAAAISPAGCMIRVYPVGREDQRQRDRMAEHLPGGVHLRHVRERPRHEPPAPERLDVAGQAQLLVGAAVDVIEHRPRDQPPRGPAQVGDVVAGGEPPPRAAEPGPYRPQLNQLADLPDFLMHATIRVRPVLVCSKIAPLRPGPGFFLRRSNPSK